MGPKNNILRFYSTDSTVSLHSSTFAQNPLEFVHSNKDLN